MQKSFTSAFIVVDCFLILLFFTGCVTSSYYLSPLYGGSTPYRSIPLHSDINYTYLFANATLYAGAANEHSHDKVYSFSGNIYKAHHFNYFNAWYGLGVNLGNYRVNPYPIDGTYYSFDPSYVNKLSGNYFFGSTNLGAGINVVIPVNTTAEWRIFGIHASLQNEFGNYLKLRKSLNPSLVSAVVTSPSLGTVSFSDEIVFKTSLQSELGFLFQKSVLLGQSYADIEFGNDYVYPKKTRFAYFSVWSSVRLYLSS